MLFLFGCVGSGEEKVEQTKSTLKQTNQQSNNQVIDERAIQEIEEAVAEVENITIENESELPDEDLPDVEELG